MYLRIVLTLLLITLVIIALELRRPAAPIAPQPPADDPAEAKLDQIIPELKLHNVPFSQAIDILSQKADVKFVVDWNSLKRDNHIAPGEPVSVELRNVPLWAAVRLITPVSIYATQQVQLNAFRNTIYIATSPSMPASVMSVRVYDVRDLLTDDYWGVKSPAGQEQAVQDARLASLESLFQPFSGLSNWVFRGGSGPGAFGWAETYGSAGRLIVIQTSYGHRKLEMFLARLRASPHPLKATGQSSTSEPIAGLDLLLQRPVNSFDVDKVRLDAIIEMVRRQTGTNVLVDWNALSRVEVLPATQVTLHVRHTTLDGLLWALCHHCGLRLDYSSDQFAAVHIDADIAGEGWSQLGVYRIRNAFAPSEERSPDDSVFSGPVPAADRKFAEAFSEFITGKQGSYGLFAWGGHLFASVSLASHHRLQQVLDALEHPRDLRDVRAADAHATSILQRRIATLRFERLSAEQAVCRVANLADFCVVIDPTTLDGGDPEIALDLRDITVEQALRAIATDEHAAPFTFEEYANLIAISHRDEAGCVVRAYDVRGIVANPGAWWDPHDSSEIFDKGDPFDHPGRTLAADVESFTPAKAAYWRGSLVLLAPPEELGTIEEFLRHLRDGGKLPQ